MLLILAFVVLVTEWNVRLGFGDRCFEARMNFGERLPFVDTCKPFLFTGSYHSVRYVGT